MITRNRTNLLVTTCGANFFKYKNVRINNSRFGTKMLIKTYRHDNEE